MKNQLFFCLILLIGFQSCSRSTGTVQTEVTAFPIERELTATVHPSAAPLLLPRYMGIWDGYLFVYKEREEYKFSIFRLPDVAYIQDAGMAGPGPDDFNLLDTRSFHATPDGTFAVVEAGSNLLKTVSYDGARLKVVKQESLLGNESANNGFYPLADSLCVTFGRMEGSHEYNLLNRKTKEAKEIGEYPDWAGETEQAKGVPTFVTYLKTCVTRPDGKRMAAFYARFKRFRIYDNQGNLLHDVNVKVPPCATRFDEPVHKQPGYYAGQPFATEQHIYALCLNQNTGEERCELHVWDWEGHAVACYHFDRRVSLMAIDPIQQKIYAIDRLNADELFSYDLPTPKK